MCSRTTSLSSMYVAQTFCFLGLLCPRLFVFLVFCAQSHTQLIDEAMPGKVDWTKVNKGKLNNFKANDNWKYAMSLVFSLTRFPPQMEEHQLSGGDESKITVLVDVRRGMF